MHCHRNFAVISSALIRRSVLTLIVSLVAFGPVSASEEPCKPRVGYFDVQPGRQFVGLFQVKLHPPDFHSPIAVQKHLFFTMTWGNLLAREINKRAGGLCGANFTPYAFPNTRVFVTAALNGMRIDQAKVVCRDALDEILQHAPMDEASIQRAVAMTVMGMEPTRPNGIGISAAILDAANIVDAVQRRIYEPNTPLHAVVSVPWKAYGVASIAEYRAWAQSQNSNEPLRSEQISICPQPNDRKQISGSVSELMDSQILPAGEIKISRGSEAIPAGPLRYSLLVRDLDASAGRFPSGQLAKRYCDQEYSFPLDGVSSNQRAIVRLRCLTTTVYDIEPWTLIFCDPEDCAAAPKEKAAITMLATELEVFVSPTEAQGKNLNGRYFITIN